MKTTQGIKLSQFDEIAYNMTDAPGFERGDMGKGKPKAARVYSVYRIEGRAPHQIAHCQSSTAWGDIVAETWPLHTLAPYTPKPGGLFGA